MFVICVLFLVRTAVFSFAIPYFLKISVNNKMAHRTEYDRQMIEHFDPSKGVAESYHSPPWPGHRTPQDVKLQDRWCNDCHNLPIMDFKKPKGQWCPSCNNNLHNKDQYEGYTPVFGFRTKADLELQNKWCPKCKCQPTARCICPNGPKDDPYHHHSGHNPTPPHRHHPNPYPHHPNPYPRHHPNPTGGGE